MAWNMGYTGSPLTRLIKNAESDFVPTTPVRQHILDLYEIGMTQSMVARAAGVAHGTISRIEHDVWPRIREQYADAILSVTPRPHHQQVHVMGFACRRRLEGLAVMGWSSRVISTRIGITGNNHTVKMWRTRPRVTWETHSRVAALYEQISHIDGGSDRTKELAIREGFLHPFMWDDIDDFYEVPSSPTDSGLPDLVVVERLLAGSPVRATAADRRAAYEVLVARGVSRSSAAAQVGINHQTAVRYSNLLEEVA